MSFLAAGHSQDYGESERPVYWNSTDCGRCGRHWSVGFENGALANFRIDNEEHDVGVWNGNVGWVLARSCRLIVRLREVVKWLEMELSCICRVLRDLSDGVRWISVTTWMTAGRVVNPINACQSTRDGMDDMRGIHMNTHGEIKFLRRSWVERGIKLGWTGL